MTPCPRCGCPHAVAFQAVECPNLWCPDFDRPALRRLLEIGKAGLLHALSVDMEVAVWLESQDAWPGVRVV